MDNLAPGEYPLPGQVAPRQVVQPKPGQDQLQLKFLHVSRAYRGRGLGQHLFKLARATAREQGVRRLYISATPSEHTINFYLRSGCWVSREPGPDLFELELEDIHLEGEV